MCFNIAAKVRGIEPILDTKSEWWSCLQQAIKIRDRLTHPRFPEDIEISKDELFILLKAVNGFQKTLLAYP